MFFIWLLTCGFLWNFVLAYRNKDVEPEMDLTVWLILSPLVWIGSAASSLQGLFFLGPLFPFTTIAWLTALLGLITGEINVNDPLGFLMDPLWLGKYGLIMLVLWVIVSFLGHAVGFAYAERKARRALTTPAVLPDAAQKTRRERVIRVGAWVIFVALFFVLMIYSSSSIFYLVVAVAGDIGGARWVYFDAKRTYNSPLAATAWATAFFLASPLCFWLYDETKPIQG